MHSEGCLTAVDLFAGCGGLTAGLRMAGFHVLGAVEMDSASVHTYRENHSDTLVWELDIRNVDPAQVLDALTLKPGQLDLLAACPPCQGFSTLRTRNGSAKVEDSRNDLVSEVTRFAEALMPRAVMMENVPGLANDGRFEDFRRRLSDLGYLGSHRILDAADYGVPQRRRRLIFLAGRDSALRFACPIRKRRSVRDVLSNLPAAGTSGDPAHDIPERRSGRVMAVIRSIPKDGGSRCDLPDALQLPCHKRSSGFKDVYGRLKWDTVAPTLTTGCYNPSKGRFLHPVADRALTIREAALLQGFPRNYWFDPLLGKEALAAMIGNALPPPFVAIHSKSVARTLRNADRKATSHSRRSLAGGRANACSPMRSASSRHRSQN